MQVVNITDKNQLNKFVGTQDKAQFLQSWEWGEFHKKVSGDVWRIGFLDDDKKLVAVATVIKKQLPMSRCYFYCPRGPVANDEFRISNGELIFKILFEEIKRIAKDEGAMFLRFEPLVDIRQLKIDIRQSLDVQPSKTLMLDLTKTEDELLAGMHQKTRYNIRLAEKRGVKIIDAGIEYLDSFWRLLDETADRDNFRSHGQDYYGEMLRIANGHESNSRTLKTPQPPLSGGHTQGGSSMVIKLLVAEYDGKIIAANIVSFFGDTVTYMHGASGAGERNIMAPYLLQWFTIKQAKNLGYKYYDFYGIDEEKWPGVTRFKKGFAGLEVEYPGTFDLIFDEGWYSVYKMIRKVRRTF
jgi:lipid II:glycine glycyltransferase (peptidoglycan interpeptide bridge formation enzyme)